MAKPFGSTILQILRDDALVPGRWDAVMQRLAQFGLRELILQWTSAENIDFYAGRPDAPECLPVLPDLVGLAARSGLRTWIGLHDDAGWWSAGRRAGSDLQAFMDKRLEALDDRLPYLAETVAELPRAAVAGWYVTEELDDQTWRTEDREAALIRFLSAVTARLRQIAPERPIAISGFANGAADARVYAAQLRRIADAAGFDRLLLQDGIGAGKCRPDQARTIALAAAQAFGGSAAQFGMIVELFDLAGQTDVGGETRPASLAAIRDRMAATAGIGDLPATSFSHAHHLTSLGGPIAAERGAEFLALLQNC